MYTPDRRQSKTLILSTKVDETSLETEVTIAFCRPTGDKLQSKTLFLLFFLALYSLLWSTISGTKHPEGTFELMTSHLVSFGILLKLFQLVTENNVKVR